MRFLPEPVYYLKVYKVQSVSTPNSLRERFASKVDDLELDVITKKFDSEHERKFNKSIGICIENQRTYERQQIKFWVYDDIVDMEIQK